MWKTGDSSRLRAGTRKAPRMSGSRRFRFAVSIVGDAAFEGAIAIGVEIGEVVPSTLEVLSSDDTHAVLVIDVDAGNHPMHEVRHRVGPAISVRIESVSDQMSGFG